MHQSVFGVRVVPADDLAGFEQLTTATGVNEQAFYADGQPACPVLALLVNAHPGAVLVQAPCKGFELWYRRTN